MPTACPRQERLSDKWLRGEMVNGSRSSRRQAEDEAGADDGATGAATVLGADDAAMRLDDLPGNRQAEPGMGAEFLTRRALAVEAVEDCHQLGIGDARSFIVDGDDDGAVVALHGERDRTARRAERDG